MFAVKRTASVPGRIRFLIVSIININGINMVGVPWGTRCSNMWLVFLIHPNSINLTHKGKARVSVRIKCLVLVKMYGNSPKKLFIRIMRNRDVRMNEFPLFSFPFLRIVFISWCSLFISKLTIMLFREGISQILSTLHTRQSSIQNNKYQVSHRYTYFSWWWAHSRPKHVEKRNKRSKKIVHQVGSMYKIGILDLKHYMKILVREIVFDWTSLLVIDTYRTLRGGKL